MLALSRLNLVHSPICPVRVFTSPISHQTPALSFVPYLYQSPVGHHSHASSRSDEPTPLKPSTRPSTTLVSGNLLLLVPTRNTGGPPRFNVAPLTPGPHARPPPAMSWMTQQQVAGVMGYLSIACWLCAQLPQVVKNARLRSCEGLALPFLINWLFGELPESQMDRCHGSPQATSPT